MAPPVLPSPPEEICPPRARPRPQRQIRCRSSCRSRSAQGGSVPSDARHQWRCSRRTRTPALHLSPRRQGRGPARHRRRPAERRARRARRAPQRSCDRLRSRETPGRLGRARPLTAPGLSQLRRPRGSGPPAERVALDLRADDGAHGIASSCSSASELARDLLLPFHNGATLRQLGSSPQRPWN